MAQPNDEKPVIVAFTLDFETGGLKCQTSACTQIAIHATRIDTFERLGTYVSYISPYNKKDSVNGAKKRKVLKSKYDESGETSMDYEQKALEYSAITMDMLEMQGKPIEVVAQEVVQFIKDYTPTTPKNMKPFLIGQNIGFDEGFFCQLLEYGGMMQEAKKYLRGSEDFYGNWHPLCLDTIVLGQLALCTNPTVNSYKLEIMCDNLGVELVDAHDADSDVAATTNVVSVLTKRMRSIGGEYNEEELGVSKTEKTRKHFKI